MLAWNYLSSIENDKNRPKVMKKVNQNGFIDQKTDILFKDRKFWQIFFWFNVENWFDFIKNQGETPQSSKTKVFS